MSTTSSTTAKPTFVYTTYIRTTPEQLWAQVLAALKTMLGTGRAPSEPAT